MQRATAFVLALTVAACARGGHEKAPTPPPRLPVAKARGPRPVAPPEWFWEAVDASVEPPLRRGLDLPLAESAIDKVEGANKVWDDLTPTARERLRRDGVLVVGEASDTPRSMGAFYTELREQRVPHMLTLDAFMAVAHLGLERALAQVESAELGPAIDTLLALVDKRLTAERTNLGTTLAEAYRVARGVIAVARSLADAAYVVAPDIAAVVAEEKSLVEAHAGMARSPVLGLVLDYTQLGVPSQAARPGAFRALSWLGSAPLALAGVSEAPGATASVSLARTSARAAMVLARLCDRDVDPTAYALYIRITKLLAFVWGAPDDIGLVELDDLATAVRIDLTKPENIVNVARVDRVRARVRVGRGPAAYDSPAGIGRTVRVFGGHAAVESVALQELVAPIVVKRFLPSTLDFAVWLGAPEARASLHEARADAFEGYEGALANATRTRPHDESELHASVHGSLVDALSTWASAPSDAAVVHPSPASDRLRVESILASWTRFRHLDQPLARAKPPAPVEHRELHVSAPLPVFVEPVPEPIARLVATIRQARRGLETLAPGAGPAASLVEIEDILKIGLKGAERHASDEPLTAEETAALASLPARMARLEDELGDVGPVFSILHHDPTTHRLLASGTGLVEPLMTFARAPGKDEAVLVVGAHVAHHEIVLDARDSNASATDAAWHVKMKSAPRAGYTSTFRLPPGRVLP